MGTPNWKEKYRERRLKNYVFHVGHIFVFYISLSFVHVPTNPLKTSRQQRAPIRLTLRVMTHAVERVYPRPPAVLLSSLLSPPQTPEILSFVLFALKELPS